MAPKASVADFWSRFKMSQSDPTAASQSFGEDDGSASAGAGEEGGEKQETQGTALVGIARSLGPEAETEPEGDGEQETEVEGKQVAEVEEQAEGEAKGDAGADTGASAKSRAAAGGKGKRKVEGKGRMPAQGQGQRQDGGGQEDGVTAEERGERKVKGKGKAEAGKEKGTRKAKGKARAGKTQNEEGKAKAAEEHKQGDKSTTEEATQPPASEPAVFQLLAPALPSPQNPVCHRCKVSVDMCRSRLVGKSAACWICPACNTKSVQLHRIFGSWPPASFAKLPKAWQEEFWRSCAEMPGGPQLEEFVVQAITRKRVELEESTVGGEFLPLSVYSKRGYDAERIARECTDTQDHPILGKCYRVCITAVYSKTVESMVREELMHHKRVKDQKTSAAARPTATRSSDSKSSSESRRRKRRQDKKDRKGKNTKDKGKNDRKVKGRESKSKRRSSSDSESGSSHQKRKRSPDSKGKRSGGKKGRTQSQERAADEQKAAAATMRLASLAIARLSPLLALLKAGVADAHFKNVPSFVADPAKVSAGIIGDMEHEASKAIKNRGAAGLSFNKVELEDAARTATERNALMCKMLDTARKHSK